jgi:hypothetical protein
MQNELAIKNNVKTYSIFLKIEYFHGLTKQLTKQNETQIFRVFFGMFSHATNTCSKRSKQLSNFSTVANHFAIFS